MVAPLRASFTLLSMWMEPRAYVPGAKLTVPPPIPLHMAMAALTAAVPAPAATGHMRSRKVGTVTPGSTGSRSKPGGELEEPDEARVAALGDLPAGLALEAQIARAAFAREREERHAAEAALELPADVHEVVLGVGLQVI